MTDSGRDEHQAAAPERVAVALLTVSDTRTPATDSSGQYLAQAVTASGHALVGRRIVNDEAAGIRAAFSDFLASGAQVVISSGGTGIAGRDVTVPVVEALIVKPLPGFGELFRLLSYREVGGAAMLSRAVRGLAEGGLVFALPGSLNAVRTAWEGLLRDELAHLVYEVFRQGPPQRGGEAK